MASDAGFFSKDPYSINLGRGSADIAYRPIAMDGRLAPSQLVVGMNSGDVAIAPQPIEPLASIPPTCGNPPSADCQAAAFDGLPEVEVFDLTDRSWRRLPHLNGGTRYSVTDPERYVDPETGSVLLRFVNDRNDGVGFSLDLAIAGSVR